MNFSFSAIPAAFNVFRAGNEMKNAAAWKNAQLIGNVLIAGVTLSRALGVNLPISDELLMEMAVGAAAIVNGILTVTTSSKVGLQESEPPAPSVSNAKASKAKLPPLNHSTRSDLPDLS